MVSSTSSRTNWAVTGGNVIEKFSPIRVPWWIVSPLVPLLHLEPERRGSDRNARGSRPRRTGSGWPRSTSSHADLSAWVKRPTALRVTVDGKGRQVLLADRIGIDAGDRHRLAEGQRTGEDLGRLQLARRAVEFQRHDRVQLLPLLARHGDLDLLGRLADRRRPAGQHRVRRRSSAAMAGRTTLSPYHFKMCT